MKNLLFLPFLPGKGFKVLDLPKYKKFLYVDIEATEARECDIYHVAHFVDYATGEETTCHVNASDYPEYLVPGENDSIVCLISIGGSGGFCTMARISVAQMKQVESYDMEVHNFRLEKRTKRGFSGIGSKKFREDGPGRIYENFEIDFHGKTIKIIPLNERQKKDLDKIYDLQP